MKLENWLRANSMSQAAFAKLIGVSDPTVHRLVHGKRTPDRHVMPRIVEATGGAVTPNDFFGMATTAPDEMFGETS